MSQNIYAALQAGKLGKPEIFQQQVCVMSIKRPVKREAVKSNNETRYSSVQELLFKRLTEVFGDCCVPTLKTPHP